MNNDEVIKRIEKAKKNKAKLPKVKAKKQIVTYIDPPKGWAYHFPKALPNPRPEDIRSWLIENGYPERDVDFALQHCRMWEEEE